MPDDPTPSHEDRLAVLRAKVDREGLQVPGDVLDYLADKFRLPHSLKSGLMQVFLEAKRTGRAIDLPFAQWVLGDAPRPAKASAEPAEEPAPEVESEPELTFELEPGPEPVPEVEPEPDPGLVFDAPATLAPVGPAESVSAPVTSPMTSPGPSPAAEPAVVWFAPVRTIQKRSLIVRAGQLLDRAGLADAIDDGDLVAVKLHFGERGSTGFVQPVYLREIVARIKAHGGKPFLTDANTLYRGQRANAVDHLACAIHNGFAYATVEAPVIIADGLDGRDAVDVPVAGTHFEEVRIGAAAVRADAMVVVTHFKGHEMTGIGGALKNVGMGLGCRSAKQRMHADFRPEVTAEKCTACGRCVTWCPVRAIVIGPDRVAVIDHETCYGCGECVAACPEGAIAAQWNTTPEAIQEKIVEHAAGALAGKEGKVVYLTFVLAVSPDCDCWHFSDAGVVADVGVLASTDIVAIERAAYDLVNEAAGLSGTRGDGMAAGTDKFIEITGVDGSHAIDYAEVFGLGTQEYELRTLE